MFLFYHVRALSSDAVSSVDAASTSACLHKDAKRAFVNALFLIQVW